jgi:hypothetical protein
MTKEGIFNSSSLANYVIFPAGRTAPEIPAPNKAKAPITAIDTTHMAFMRVSTGVLTHSTSLALDDRIISGRPSKPRRIPSQVQKE